MAVVVLERKNKYLNIMDTDYILRLEVERLIYDLRVYSSGGIFTSFNNVQYAANRTNEALKKAKEAYEAKHESIIMAAIPQHIKKSNKPE